MKRILVTSANGQLGTALRRKLAANTNFVTLFTDADTLNITDHEAIRTCFAEFKPDFVINTAAYTAVDKAEEDRQSCHLLNAEAPGFLASACNEFEARLIHISTDYVFNGNTSVPYKTTDTPDPRNVYGLTKLEGENRVRETLPQDHIILRTAWLYSVHGHNFAKTMLALAATRDEVGVVADQWGTPTYAPVLADAIVAILAAKRWFPGIYHITGSGRTTWYDFTRAIFKEAGIDSKVSVCPLTTDEYPTPARRPPYSVLDTSAFTKTYGFNIPDWRESLHEFFNDFED